MRELLRTMATGVPVESLLARIQGRRAFLVGNWDDLLLAPDPLAVVSPAPWRSGLPVDGGIPLARTLQQEYAWAFASMEEPLRLIFVPFFWLAEVRTVAICLRGLAGGRDFGEDVLAESLLANDVKRAIREGRSVVSAVNDLTRLLSPHDPAFERLPKILQSGGTGAVEAALADISLEHCAAAPPHPVMGHFVALLIDGRNLVSLAKQMRWRLISPPLLLSGGTLPSSSLKELFARQDTAGIARLAARMGRLTAGEELDSVEQTVLAAQGNALRRLAREPDGIGTILDYLWRCGIEARNLGLLARQPVAGIEEVSREIGR